MKKLSLNIVLLFSLVFYSCGTIKVASDYDSEADFSKYKTYAFYKSFIDKVEISDIDKKRILKSIKKSFTNKGMSINETPDLLINISTKSSENIYIDNSFYSPYYTGWYPHYGRRSHSRVAYSTSEGALYIDIIDTKSKQLIWQGKGIGVLSSTKANRDELIENFVNKILEVYPPTLSEE